MNKSQRLVDIQRKFNLNVDSLDIVDSLDELRKSPPNIIIAECKKISKFRQTGGEIQQLQKNCNYIMPISMYASLEYNNINGKNIRSLKPAKTRFEKIFKPYRGQDLTNKTLFVSRTGGIGDLLFIQPNLKFLKETYPSCKIIFATSQKYHNMVQNWNFVDEVFSLPCIDKKIFKSHYHAIFEGVIERTREAEKTNAYELFSKWLGLNLPISKLRPSQMAKVDITYEVDCNLEKYFNIKVTSDKICTVQLKASSPIRTPHPVYLWLPVLKYISSLGYKIVITDNPIIHNQIDKIINTYFSEIKHNIFNFTKYSSTISHAISLAYLSNVVIGPDSAMVHIAESVNTKNFGIYGPFPGNVRLATYKYNSWIDCNNECSPCFKHGHLPCEKALKNNRCSPCYNNIDMNLFKQKFEELMNKNV